MAGPLINITKAIVSIAGTLMLGWTLTFSVSLNANITEVSNALIPFTQICTLLIFNSRGNPGIFLFMKTLLSLIANKKNLKRAWFSIKKRPDSRGFDDVTITDFEINLSKNVAK